MEKEIAKETLLQIIFDLESEQKEIERKIQGYEDEILQVKKYLQSLYEKEDTDVMIFSPRNIESRYKEDIAKSKNRIRALEKENQALYHKQNLLIKRISALHDVWQDIRKQTDSPSDRSFKDDTSVTYKKVDREYAHWIVMHEDQVSRQSEEQSREHENQLLAAQNRNESENLEDDKVDMLHIVQALDNDRKRIASDLHDTIVQDLVHTIHMVELCDRYMDQDPVRAKLELVSIEKYLRETIQRARNFISDLRPMIFDDFGFRGTLMNAVDELQKYTSMMIAVDVDELPDVDNEKCIVLYRVGMELLRNAIFHSGGDKVTLTLKRKDGAIELTVTDNGSGFSMNEDMEKHFGLELVKERAYLIGAAFHIDSTDKGTCAQIILKE